MKKFLAYSRVSTQKQANKDNSIPAQKRIITDYAEKKGFEIVDWYSEARSGFKGKRGEFHKMIKRLESPEIEGVIFHKLDRSARNAGDFALIDKMMTKGKIIAVIEGEFDTSRAAGRLAFRNFCNLCVWYSENLSEEVSTKMEEVLLKGYYPHQPPIGYRTGIKKIDEDHKKKYPDPILAPYVKEAFELFATTNYSVATLCEYMRKKGMTNSKGGHLRKNVFYGMLRNPFYYGLIEWRRKRNSDRKVYFDGNHEPLITKKLFEKVQKILDNSIQRGENKHNHTYAKMIKCECGNFLIPALHKEKVYLECHNKKCKFSSLTEDQLESQIIVHLAKNEISSESYKYAQIAVNKLTETIRVQNKEKRQSLNLQLGKLDAKLDKIKESVFSGFLSPEEGIAEKNKVIKKRHDLRDELQTREDKEENALWEITFDVVKLFNFLPSWYKEINPILKRKLLNFFFLNLRLTGSTLLVEAVPAIDGIQNTNILLNARKLLLNQQPTGSTSQSKAILKTQKTPKNGVLLNGAKGRT